MGYWVTEEAQKFLEVKHKVEASTATEVAFVVRLKQKEVSELLAIMNGFCDFLPLCFVSRRACNNFF